MKKFITIICAIPLLIGVLIGLYYSIFVFDDSSTTRIVNKNIFSDLQSKHVKITEYFVYGTNFNISGTLEGISKDNIESARLIITDGMYEELNYKLDYSVKENVFEFTTTEIINTGIDLENLKNGNYFVLLRFKFNNSNEHKFYTCENASEYEPIEYYTITKEAKNQKIDIGFAKREYKKSKIDYMYINKKDSVIPEEVYDFVIDPGHGGKDSGVKSGEYTERDVVLSIAEKLYNTLKQNGYKVYITRDGKNEENMTATSMYDENDRINNSCKTKAKYMISLHLNDSGKKLSGLEVYSPSKSDLTLANNIAKNIIQNTELSYSNSNTHKKADGVYVNNFTKISIATFKNSCEKKGFEPYEVDTNTQYLYTIREVGGIGTNAYVDGRNTQYGKNNYYNANYGIECYQIEMGYIDTDLQKILNSKDEIADSVANALIDYINN